MSSKKDTFDEVCEAKGCSNPGLQCAAKQCLKFICPECFSNLCKKQEIDSLELPEGPFNDLLCEGHQISKECFRSKLDG
jgi:hypothetical protein